jgi:hypothetical protein
MIKTHPMGPMRPTEGRALSHPRLGLAEADKSEVWSWGTDNIAYYCQADAYSVWCTKGIGTLASTLWIYRGLPSGNPSPRSSAKRAALRATSKGGCAVAPILRIRSRAVASAVTQRGPSVAIRRRSTCGVSSLTLNHIRYLC